MHTVIAYSESQDLAGARGNVAGVPDQHMKVQGDGIYIGEYNKLLGAYACIGSLGEDARLVSPSLRRINPYYIRPLELAIDPAGDPIHAVSRNILLDLDVNEALECQIIADPAAAEQETVLVFLASGAIQPIDGKIHTVAFTITLALVAGAWAFSEIDFVDELPVGNYKVVGAVLEADGTVGFRFVPVGASHRPGAPTVPACNYEADKTFRFGNFGTWFTMSTLQPPGVEVIASADAVSATYYGYMDIIPG